MSSSSNSPLPFYRLAEAIQSRRSDYGFISGLRLDRVARGEAWSSLPYRPIFIGDIKTGVLHGGVVTAMLDESCGMAVQLALDGTQAIATLDLRIDYQRPATPGLDIKAHSICYRVTRSIAFVRSTAFQEDESDPVASATACFMIGANRTNMMAEERMIDGIPPLLEAPEDPTGAFANSPFARFLGIRAGNDDFRRNPRAQRYRDAQADRPYHQLPALRPRAGQPRQGVDRQAGPPHRGFRSAGLAGRRDQADCLGVWSFYAEQ